MAWTETARRDYARRGLRYTSDCTDDEWAVVAPLLQPMSKVGRPREHDPRTLWNAIQYMATTGCQWAQLPKEFPPFTTVQYHFYRMRDSGLLDLINEILVAVTLLTGQAALDLNEGPAMHKAMVHCNAAFGHHFLRISQAQIVSQIPSHA